LARDGRPGFLQQGDGGRREPLCPGSACAARLYRMPHVLIRDWDNHYAEVISAPVGRTPVEDQHPFWLAKTLERLRRTTNLPLFPDLVYMPVPLQ